MTGNRDLMFNLHIPLVKPLSILGMNVNELLLTCLASMEEFGHLIKISMVDLHPALHWKQLLKLMINIKLLKILSWILIALNDFNCYSLCWSSLLKQAVIHRQDFKVIQFNLIFLYIKMEFCNWFSTHFLID